MTTLAGPHTDACFTTVQHEGTPVGKTISIDGVDTYISEPKGDKKGIILYLSDVFGPFYINNQLLQDYFATNGYLVLGIDYFFGDPIHLHLNDPDFDRAAWSTKTRSQAAEAFPRWDGAVRKKYGTGTEIKYFSIGYCFGAPFSVNLAGSEDVSAAAIAHPSSLTEEQFKSVKKPLLLLCAETDNSFPSSARHRAEDILIEEKATFHLKLFSGVSHGFATKGDPNVENIRWAKEEAARSALGWFNRFSV